MKARVILLSLAAAALPLPFTAATARTDLLDLASGSTVLAFSSEYGGGWPALALIDGTAQMGWCSDSGKAFPNTLVLELPQRHVLTSIALDNIGAQEASYGGVSARTVEVHASTTSAGSGYKKLATLEAPKGARKEFTLPAGSEAQWLKLVVTSNWGNEEYTELMELEAYGRPGPPAPAHDISGVYDTNYSLLALHQSGNRVAGCYYDGEGVLSGATTGRTAQFEWRQAFGSDAGTAMVVPSSKEDFLNGLWYRGGALSGTWFGPRAPAGQKPGCLPGSSAGLGDALKATGRAIVYGIQFDSDSANLKPESEATLRRILELLNSQKGLRLVIEGHTDSTNTDAYNLDLSQRRSAAVVAWLTKQEIEASRLSSKGFGKARPVADNTAPQGGALNRRVEIAAAK